MKEWLNKRLKKLRKYKKRYKGMKVIQKVIKLLIALTNIGITAWKFYENVLKDQIEKQKNK